MPRWPKNPIDYDLEIEKSQAKIAKYTTFLDNEKERLEDLMGKKRDSELQELYMFMQESGLTAPQVLQTLQASQSEPRH